MKGNHVHAHRAWELIRDRGELTTNEFRHLEHCRTCNDWLGTFVNQASKSGFHISFEIPPYEFPSRGQAAMEPFFRLERQVMDS